MATPGQPTSYKPEYDELAHQGQEHTITNTVSYPPDTQACMFWLRNRQRQYWQAKVEAPPKFEAADDMAALLDAAGESNAPCWRLRSLIGVSLAEIAETPRAGPGPP
jgi:hypothetical protein